MENSRADVLVKRKTLKPWVGKVEEEDFLVNQAGMMGNDFQLRGNLGDSRDCRQIEEDD